MNKNITCNIHPDNIKELICLNPKCNNNLLCPICLSLPSPIGHMGHKVESIKSHAHKLPPLFSVSISHIIHRVKSENPKFRLGTHLSLFEQISKYTYDLYERIGISIMKILDYERNKILEIIHGEINCMKNIKREMIINNTKLLQAGRVLGEKLKIMQIGIESNNLENIIRPVKYFYDEYLPKMEIEERERRNLKLLGVADSIIVNCVERIISLNPVLSVIGEIMRETGSLVDVYRECIHESIANCKFKGIIDD